MNLCSSISRSIASSGRAISCDCESAMSAKADALHLGQSLCSEKTQRPVQFEITEQTRESLSSWIRYAELGPDAQLFSTRLRASPHLSTRQYARIVRRWVQAIGLNPAAYGTHTMRRTKVALI